MKSNIKEQSKKLKKAEKELKSNIRFLENSISQYHKLNPKASKDTAVIKARSAIKTSLEKIAKFSSPEYIRQKLGLSIIPASSQNNVSSIIRLSNKAVGGDINFYKQLANHYKYLLSNLEQELEKVKESNFKIVKKLAKYRSTEEKKQDDADIFIDLLKKSDKIPTVEALSNFTNNRISKSTWHRKLKNDAFLYILSQKITDLARKTKNKDRIDFYISVSSEFHDKFTHALAKKTKNEFIYEDRFKTRNLNHSYDMDMNNSENPKGTLDIFDDEKDNSWLGNN